jgi:hypothetical protein
MGVAIPIYHRHLFFKTFLDATNISLQTVGLLSVTKPQSARHCLPTRYYNGSVIHEPRPDPFHPDVHHQWLVAPSASPPLKPPPPMGLYTNHGPFLSPATMKPVPRDHPPLAAANDAKCWAIWMSPEIHANFRHLNYRKCASNTHHK